MKIEYADMMHERHLSDDSVRRMNQARAAACAGEDCKCNACLDLQFARVLARFKQLTGR